jgi:hypothetical protein
MDMQTQMQDEQEPKTVDPAQVALDAINDFDRYMQRANDDVEQREAWRLLTRAELRVSFAVIAEARKQTNVLTGIFAKLQAIEFNTRGQ